MYTTVSDIKAELYRITVDIVRHYYQAEIDQKIVTTNLYLHISCLCYSFTLLFLICVPPLSVPVEVLCNLKMCFACIQPPCSNVVLVMWREVMWGNNFS